MGTSFYFAHFSDPHFSISPNYRGYIDAPGVPAKLRTRLSWLFLHGGDRRRLLGSFDVDAAKALSDRLALGFHEGLHSYDGFIVTGDLATIGTLEDLDVARRYFEGKLVFDAKSRNQLQYLEAFRFPTNSLALLPGNHERYEGSLCQPGGTHFEHPTAFCNTWRITATPSMDKRVGKVQPFQFSKNGETLTVLAADFSLRSGVYHRKPWKYLGRGLVDDVILRPLVEKTESEKKNSAVIWAVHFPPRFRALSRFLALEGEDLLIDAAVRAGIKYVVAGHTHICDRYFGRTKQSGNCVTVICSGSPTAQGTEAPSFFDLEIVVHDNTIADIRPAIVGLKEFIHQRTQKRVRRFTL